MDIDDRFINEDATLPYDVDVQDVVTAIENTYEYYDGLNEWHENNGYGELSEYLRANNGRSDFIGNIVTQELADVSNSIVHNKKDDGFPDLLPKDMYSSYDVHRGDHGIETKCSKNSGGWYAHSSVSSWVLVFRYTFDGDSIPEFTQVVAANLISEDWNHQPSKDGSRRTPTTTINKDGMHKLRLNPIIQKPKALTGKGDKLRTYKDIQSTFDDQYNH